MKSNELIAAGADDVWDFGLENIHMCMFCWGAAHLLASPHQKGKVEESMLASHYTANRHFRNG